MEQSSILGFFQKGSTTRPERPGRTNASRPGQPYSPRTGPHATSEYPEPRRGGARGRRRGRGGSGRGPGDHPHPAPDTRRNGNLKLVAEETIAELPKILSTIPAFDAKKSESYNLVNMNTLSPLNCPGHTLPPGDKSAGQKGTRIRVYDMDTFDAALQLDPDYKVYTHLGLPKPTSTTSASPTTSASATDTSESDSDGTDTIMKDTPTTTKPPTLVLNLASERTPGGGWTNGALAQEECLCYRSSLSLSLHRSFYPLPANSCIYTPSVLLLRTSMTNGHTLLTPTTPPLALPVVSVLSVAALRTPAISKDTDGSLKFKNDNQRADTKRRIRLTLRVAANKGHARLVLGALGCGVFANPAQDVARCFLEVLRENEFSGGWWEEVVFAVLDNKKGGEGGKTGKGNFGVFSRVLDGEVV
ncbi:hypothetical protein NX059_003132 [Plenodomus lindquistii]|nr:hypothetical protein NX059_003132 [Plenodomus lindquistii]